MTKFLSYKLLNFKPYRLVTAKSFELEDQGEKIFKLNWNEGFFGLKGFKEFNRYANPDTSSCLETVKSIFPEYEQFNCRIFPGTDFAHVEVLRTFSDIGDKVLINGPTYDNFRCTAESFGCQIIYTKRLCKSIQDLKFEIQETKPKITYICNPNNPTGNIIDDLNRVCSEFPETLFLIDEAYMEFSSRRSFNLPQNNLIIFKTFSKAFSIAGIRLGLIFTSKELCNDIDLIYNPKHNSTIALNYLNVCNKSMSQIKDYVEKIKTNREIFYNDLTNRFYKDIEVKKSEGNFIFLHIKDKNKTTKLYKALEKNKIFVRLFENFHNLTGLRITIHPNLNVMKKIVKIINDQNAENKY